MDPNRPSGPKQPGFFSADVKGGASAEGVVEEVVRQWRSERAGEPHADHRTEVERRQAILGIVRHVLAVQGIRIPDETVAHIARRAYSEIFGFGALDPCLRDDHVNTIMLDGIHSAAVRTKPGGRLEAIEPLFTHGQQLHSLVERLMDAANVSETLRSEPIVQFGLSIAGRPIGVYLTRPPFAALDSVELRLHPATALALSDLVSDGFMDEAARAYLQAIAHSEHGFMIVGEPVAGKTTLMGAMALEMVDGPPLAVEQVAELVMLGVCAPPAGLQGAAQALSEHVAMALAQSASHLIVDEIRGDELEAVALLMESQGVRLGWCYRGTPVVKRLRSSLSILAQRAMPAAPNAAPAMLFGRLPFVILVERVSETLRLHQIAEWQTVDDPAYPQLVPLLIYQEGGWRLTGAERVHPLG
jgi:type IV secretory pathway ATPase VirB11/archaellum biosynthesis ATPase